MISHKILSHLHHSLRFVSISVPLLLYCIFQKSSSVPALPKHIKFSKRDYSNYDEQALASEFNLIDWDSVLPRTNDVNALFNASYSKVSLIVDKHIPIKQLSKKALSSYQSHG